VEVACDVNNPLCGECGASNVFGKQKGAAAEMIEVLDYNLRHYAEVTKEQFGKDVLHESGAGAAGGLGAGLMAFLGGTLKKGIGMVIEYSQLEEKVKAADMVWTGYGIQRKGQHIIREGHKWMKIRGGLSACHRI
jgi:glycerate kinase